MSGSSVNLYILRRKGVATGELAGELARLGTTTAFVSTPAAFHVARVKDDGRLCILDNGRHDETSLPLDDAYEVRAFGSRAELRWTRDGTTGEMVILTEDASLADGIDPLGCISSFDRSYLLWGGDADDKPDTDWSIIADGRVGRIAIPHGKGDGILRLRGREYVATGVHGNAYVCAERYVGFVRVAEKPPASEEETP